MSLPKKRVRSTCSKCGKRALFMRYFTGKWWTGTSYCRECNKTYQNAKKQRRRDDLTWDCPQCHKPFHPKQHQVERRRTTTIISYCSRECVKLSQRVDPGMCLAPVPGGCGRKAVTRASGLCASHAKRKERGCPRFGMSDPIGARVHPKRPDDFGLSPQRRYQLSWISRGLCYCPTHAPLAVNKHGKAMRKCEECRVRDRMRYEPKLRRNNV